MNTSPNLIHASATKLRYTNSEYVSRLSETIVKQLSNWKSYQKMLGDSTIEHFEELQHG